MEPKRQEVTFPPELDTILPRLQITELGVAFVLGSHCCQLRWGHRAGVNLVLSLRPYLCPCHPSDPQPQHTMALHHLPACILQDLAPLLEHTDLLSPALCNKSLFDALQKSLYSTIVLREDAVSGRSILLQDSPRASLVSTVSVLTRRPKVLNDIGAIKNIPALKDTVRILDNIQALNDI